MEEMVLHLKNIYLCREGRSLLFYDGDEKAPAKSGGFGVFTEENFSWLSLDWE